MNREGDCIGEDIGKFGEEVWVLGEGFVSGIKD